MIPQPPAEFWLGLSEGARVIIILIVALAVVAIAGFKLLAGRVKAGIEAAESAQAAAQAAETYAKPTGNGFAARTTTALDILIEKMGANSAILERVEQIVKDHGDRLDRLEQLTRDRLS